MARVKFISLTDADITRLEGCIQTLTGEDARFRPKSSAIDYIAAQLGVSSKVVREWVRRARPMARRTETTNAFFCAYEKIAALLVEQLEVSVWQTATTPGGRDATKAALWLMPRVNPECYGDEDDEDDSSDLLSVSDVPQEVFDAMTPEQLATLDKAQQMVIEAMAMQEAVVKEAQAKVLAAEIAEQNVH